MSYVKNYNVGQIQLELPTSNYIHELPLLSFADIHGNVNLSLVFNYGLKAGSSNPFNIAAGYKLNMQKRIVMSNNVPTAFQNEGGKVIDLNSADIRYAFDDDTQRIIRRTGSTYELENPDFSKECYDQVGKITKAYDKYGVLVLSYAYDSGGKLTSITYRSEKTISFTYDSSNRLNKVTYAGKNISLAYTTSGITLTHYTGVTFTLTSSGMNFSATATATENSTSVSYTTKITKNSNYILAISNLVDGSTVNTTTYKFPGIVTSYNTDFSQVEITDHYGARKRIQFNENKPLYSYEIGSSDAEFNNDKYVGNVQIHNIFNNKSCFNSGGSQGINDGYSLTKTDAYSEVSWGTSLSSSDKHKGFYILSGWLKLPDSNYSSEYIPLNIAKNINSLKYEFRLPKPPVGQWSYFYVAFPYDESSISAFIKKYHGNLETRDFRLSFQTTHVLTDDDSTHVPITEDVLIYHGGTTPLYIPINSSTFACSSLAISSYGQVYFEDLLKYKINQRKNRNKTEFYCDKGKKILITSASADVTVTYGGNSYNLSDCYLGKRNYLSNGIVVSQIIDNDSNTFIISKTVDANNKVISSQSFNNHLDIISSTSDGITTNYQRTNNLITEEKVSGMYIIRTSYENNKVTIYKIDETDNSIISYAIYNIDNTWGVVTSIEQSDGSIITNTYDDACTLLNKTFEGDTDISNSSSYASGNLSALENGELKYKFSYSGGRLSEISKYNVSNNSWYGIESYSYEKNANSGAIPMQVVNKYPASTPLHTVIQNYDKYGRLTEVGGAIINTYDVDPHWSYGNNIRYTGSQDDYAPNSNGELNHNTYDCNNASAKLSTSYDSITGETTRYGYHGNRLVGVKVSDSTSTISQEIFTYDENGRSKSDRFDYDLSNNKFVKSVVSYDDSTKSPITNNRVKSYSYYVNSLGIARAKTINYLDSYSRITKKEVAMVGNQFNKIFSYNKAQIGSIESKYFSSKSLQKNEYDYDSFERIIGERYIDGTTKNKSYEYDNHGRLTRENNELLDKTFVFCYDSIGNISSVESFPYTTGSLSAGTGTIQRYTYNSAYPDRLATFNGKSISYNNLGCPQYYDNKTWIWTKGKLARIYRGAAQQPGSTYEDCTFTYDAYGRRIQKYYIYDPNPAVARDGHYYYKTKYTYDESGRLIHEFYTEYYDTGSTITKDFIYLYDETGIIGFVFSKNGGQASTYYYHRNLQGDVIAIYDTVGNLQAKYAYDAWGNCTIVDSTNSDIAQTNPIRYRGYYYDRETRLYYLNARYYNPEWRRFISPDDAAYLDPETPNGLNLYAYCNNDPVNYVDPSGHWIETVFDLFSLGASVVEVVIDPLNPLNWAGLIGDAVDLLPFVTCVGEGVRATKMFKYADDIIDSSHDTIKFVKAADYADNFADGGKMLNKFDHVDDYYKFTVSNHVDGTKLHTLFMDNGGSIVNTKLRYDGLDPVAKNLFELKPYNKRNVRKGVQQIIQYNKALGGGYNMIIVLY